MPAENTVRHPSSYMLWCIAGIWLTVLASIGIFIGQWRLLYWPPHFLFVVIPIGLAALFLTMLLLGGLKRIVLGPSRIGAIGALIVGVCPLMFWPVVTAEFVWRGTSRLSLVRGWQTDPIAMMLSNAADVEILRRFPDKTVGEHVILYQTEPNDASENLVAEMDAYIEGLTAELETELIGKVRWVRGPIFGVDRMSLHGWAISTPTTSENSKSLIAIDKHETAHAVLSLLANADSDPPSVLTEGWAERCSRDIQTLNEELAQQLDDESHPSWDALVSPTWYNRSAQPVYTVGGPTVQYLLDLGGGQRFLQIYRDARNESFPDDFQSIYGMTWNELAANLRTDLSTNFPALDVRELADEELVDASDESAELIGDAAEYCNAIALADSIPNDSWLSVTNQFVPLYAVRSTAPAEEFSSYTTKQGTAGSIAGLGPIGVPDGSELVQQSTSKVYLTAEEAIETTVSGNASIAIVATQSRTFIASRDPGEIERTSCLITDSDAKEDARAQVESFAIEEQLMGDFVGTLRGLSSQPQKLTVTRLQISDEDAWKISFDLENSSDGLQIEIEVDPDQAFRIVEMRLIGDEAITRMEFAYLADSAGTYRPVQVQTLVQNDSGVPVEQTVEMRTMTEAELQLLWNDVTDMSVSDCEVATPAPGWLIAIRIVSLGWAGLALVLLMAFALFRL
jgi:hypothetical protein